MAAEYAIIDFETTGLSAGWHRIIEVGAVRVREGAVVDTFSQLLDPGVPVPAFITGLTGISNAMVRGQPSPEQVMPALRAFLGDCPAVAHNASFDAGFYRAELARAGLADERPFLCTMRLARRLVPDAPNHQLGVLARHLQLEPPAGFRAHRALGDALLTAALWDRLTRRLSARLGGVTPEFAVYQAVMSKPRPAAERYLQQLAVAGVTRDA